MTLHLHLHHSHPDQAAPGQAGQQADRVLRGLNVILDFLKEEFLCVENTIILMFGGAVWISTVECNDKTHLSLYYLCLPITVRPDLSPNVATRYGFLSLAEGKSLRKG